MSSEISLEKIDPSYWKTKDKEWVEQRQAQWPSLESIAINPYKNVWLFRYNRPYC